MTTNSNKTKFKLTCLSLLLAAGAVWSENPSFGCAFGIDPYFTFTNHPDFPLKNYASGKLGVLQSGYARSYLVVAYRYLAGRPLTSEEQQGFVSLWDTRLTPNYSGCTTDTAAWLKARATVPGASKLESIDTERPVSADLAFQVYCNCQTPAFVKAAETLNALVGKFGAGSNEVKEWLSAQDKVFSNCGESSYAEKKTPVTIPAALPAAANEVLQKHRAYQIAAANFYAQKFAVATKDFDAIAADNSSPWRDISGYLAARSMIREGSLATPPEKPLFQAAEKRIKQLQTNPAYSKMQEELSALDDYLSVRLTPELYLQGLTKKPLTARTAGDLTKTVDLLVGGDDTDVTAPKYATLPASLKKLDMIDWVITFESDDDAATAHAIERWKTTRSLPWLVAAANAVDAKSPEAAAILAAASKEQSPAAKWVLFSDVNRLNIEKGKPDAARSALDKVLAAPPADLSLSSLNQLKTQRLPLSRSLDEFLHFGVQTPAAIVSSGGVDQVPDDVEDREKGKNEKTAPLFTQESGYVLDNKMPLRMLMQVAQSKDLPTNLKSNVAWTSFVRSVLIDDDAMAHSLAGVMRPFNKARQKLVEAYLSAATPDDRKFAAVFMMLQFSSGQPNPVSGIIQEDGYGDDAGWWWSEKPVAGDPGDAVEKIEPVFLTAADKTQVKLELAKLQKAATAPNYLTKVVLDRVKSNPTDPRIPQALHLAVKATHFGSTDDKTTGLSKQAFLLLHSKYKTSTWTKQTPYWY